MSLTNDSGPLAHLRLPDFTCKRGKLSRTVKTMSNEANKTVPLLSRAEIESKAVETLRQHGLFSIPVDPVALANRSGIKVMNAAFSEEGLSGMVAKRGDNIHILVNQNDSPLRKRFTIAHELGHYALHLSLTDGEFIDRDADLFREEESGALPDNSRLQEIQANQFAAALLMPDPLVRKAYHAGITDLQSLARFFNVSESAMGYRMDKLQLRA